MALRLLFIALSYDSFVPTKKLEADSDLEVSFTNNRS